MSQPAARPFRPRMPARLVGLAILLSLLVVAVIGLILSNYFQVGRATEASRLSNRLLPGLSALQAEVLRLDTLTRAQLSSDLPNYDLVTAQRQVVAERLADLRSISAGRAAYAEALEPVDAMLQTVDLQLQILAGADLSSMQKAVATFELERSLETAEAALDQLYQSEAEAFFQATDAAFAAVRNTQQLLLGASAIILALGAVLLFALRQSTQTVIGQAYDRLQVAAEVGQAASSILDLEAMLTSALNLIRDRFGYYHASIFLIDERGDNAVLRAATGEAGRVLKERNFRLPVGSHSIVGQAAAERRMLTSTDVSREPYYLKEDTLPETRSELAVPLIFGEQLLGVLDVQAQTTQAFSEVDERVLQTLADQIAVAIANATRYGSEQARTERLSILTQAALDISRPQLGLQAQMDLIARRALDLFGADAAGLWLAADAEAMELKAATGGAPWQPGQRRKRGEDLVGQVFATGRTVRIQDYAAWIGLRADDTPVHASLATPLSHQGQVGGVLALARSRPGRVFTNEDERTFELFATQAAAAIENARLLEETRRRAAQMEVSAEVARVAAMLHDVPELLQTTVRLISERFGFYHAGLFLLDEQREWAVLQAASSHGGQRMLERGHRLRVGQQGIVGYVTSAGRARIVLDVGADAVHFQNPDLPDTHSEMAVPLFAREEVIGALDVQSVEANAFSEEDVRVLQALANQLGVAIENAYLFQTTQRNLLEMQSLQQEARRALHLSGSGITYRYDGVEVHPLAQPPAPDESTLEIPIHVGGTQLGVIALRRPGEAWSADDEILSQTVAERMALALENARLFETTRASLAETARLYRASRAIAGGQSQAEIVRAIIEHVLEPHYAYFAVALAEDGFSRPLSALQPVAVWQAGSGVRMDVERQAPLTAEQLPVMRRVRIDAPAILPSLDTPDVDPRSRDFLLALGLQAMALVPLAAGGALVGAFLVGTRSTYPFPEEETRTLQALADQAAVAIENLRLLEETRQRIAELATLNRISQVMASQSDLNTLLSQVGERVIQTFGVTDGYVALYDPQTSLIEIPYFVEQGQQLSLDPVPLGEGLASHIIRTRQPLLLNRDAERRAAELGAIIVGKLARSFLGVPIIAGDEVIGVINVQSVEKEGLFNEADASLLATIAASAGAAIQNARLFAETQRRAQQLATAAEISRASISLLDTDQLIGQACELIRERFDLYYAAIFLVDAAGQWAVLRSATGEAGRVLLERQHRLEVGGQSMVGTAVSRREARVALDVGAEPVRFANPLLPDTRSELALPLAVGQTVLGALDVQSTRANAFTEADLTVLQTMADQLAAAVQNARLFAETQERVAELATLNRIGQALTRHADLNAQLNEAGDRLLEYFGVPNGYIALYNRQTNLIEIPFFKEHGELVTVDPFPLGEGVTSIILRSRLPLMINRDAEKRLQEMGARVVGRPARSFLGVPIVVGDEAIGVINVQSTELEDQFTDADLNLLQTIAANIGAAVQTARLFAETQYRAQQLATASEVSRVATSTLDVEQLLASSVEILRERFRFYHVAIYTVEPGAETVVLRAATGEAGRQLLARRHQLEIGSKSLVGAATFTRQAVVVQDVTRDPAHYANPLLPDTRSQAVIPLMSGDAVIGALDVHSAAPGAFGETDLTVLRTIADQIASAVQNARLFAAARRLASREQALNQLSTRLRGMLDLSHIASTAVEELGRALQARRVVLNLGTEVDLRRRLARPGNGDGNGSGAESERTDG